MSWVVITYHRVLDSLPCMYVSLLQHRIVLTKFKLSEWQTFINQVNKLMVQQLIIETISRFCYQFICKKKIFQKMNLENFYYKVTLHM